MVDIQKMVELDKEGTQVLDAVHGQDELLELIDILELYKEGTQ